MLLTLFMLLIQYAVVCTISYYRIQSHRSMSQLSVAKLSLKVILNHLNEAIILRSEDGTIGYCNDLGLQLIRKVSKQTMHNDLKLNRFLTSLISMDFLNHNLFNKKQSDTNLQL